LGITINPNEVIKYADGTDSPYKYGMFRCYKPGGTWEDGPHKYTPKDSDSVKFPACEGTYPEMWFLKEKIMPLLYALNKLFFGNVEDVMKLIEDFGASNWGNLETLIISGGGGDTESLIRAYAEGVVVANQALTDKGAVSFHMESCLRCRAKCQELQLLTSSPNSLHHMGRALDLHLRFSSGRHSLNGEQYAFIFDRLDKMTHLRYQKNGKTFNDTEVRPSWLDGWTWVVELKDGAEVYNHLHLEVEGAIESITKAEEKPVILKKDGCEFPIYPGKTKPYYDDRGVYGNAEAMSLSANENHRNLIWDVQDALKEYFKPSGLLGYLSEEVAGGVFTEATTDAMLTFQNQNSATKVWGSDLLLKWKEMLFKSKFYKEDGYTGKFNLLFYKNLKRAFYDFKSEFVGVYNEMVEKYSGVGTYKGGAIVNGTSSIFYVRSGNTYKDVLVDLGTCLETEKSFAEFIEVHHKGLDVRTLGADLADYELEYLEHLVTLLQSMGKTICEKLNGGTDKAFWDWFSQIKGLEDAKDAEQPAGTTSTKGTKPGEEAPETTYKRFADFKEEEAAKRVVNKNLVSDDVDAGYVGMIHNIITQTTIYLPFDPETISDNVSMAEDSQAVRGRSSQFVGFDNTGDRAVSMSIDLHADFCSGWGAEPDCEGQGLIDTLNALKAIEYPDYSSAGAVIPPMVWVKFGDISLMGICTSVDIERKGPYRGGRRLMASVSLAFKAVVVDQIYTAPMIESQGNDFVRK